MSNEKFKVKNGLSATGNITVSDGVGTPAGSVELRTSGDIVAYRDGGTTGVIFLNQANTKYLHFDGTNYVLPGSPVVATNITAAGNVTGSSTSCTGNAVTATNAAGSFTVPGTLTVGNGGSSDIYMTDTDEGTRRIHCNSNRIGFLSQVGNWGSYCNDDGSWVSDAAMHAPTFNGALNGNANTATTLSGDQSNWASLRSGSVANMLGWKNYGNGHVIFDASNGTAPNGTAVNNSNPQTYWSGTYPTLMGWNGSSTYGVRVDVARYAESSGSSSVSIFTTSVVHQASYGVATYNPSGTKPMFVSFHIGPPGVGTYTTAVSISGGTAIALGTCVNYASLWQFDDHVSFMVPPGGYYTLSGSAVLFSGIAQY